MSDYDSWVEHQHLHSRPTLSVDYDTLRKKQKEEGYRKQVHRTCNDGPTCNDPEHLEIVEVEK